MKSSNPWSGRVNLQNVDTTPGASGPFAPPADWTGNADNYLELMRERYRTCPATRQQIAVIGRRIVMVAFTGPMAGVAAKIAKKSVERL